MDTVSVGAAFNYAKRLADEESLIATYMVGWLFETINENHKDAMLWFRKTLDLAEVKESKQCPLAEEDLQVIRMAQFGFGRGLRGGFDGPPDEKQGVSEIRDAALKGLPEAAIFYGFWLHSRSGLERGPQWHPTDDAIGFFMKPSEIGYPKASFALYANARDKKQFFVCIKYFFRGVRQLIGLPRTDPLRYDPLNQISQSASDVERDKLAAKALQNSNDV